jgi:hypothetical protein
MDITTLSLIEAEEKVTFRLKSGKVTVKGTPAARASAIARVGDARDELPELLRERDGETEDILEVEIPTKVPSLAVQRANYVSWFSAQPTYYHPDENQIDAMFAACQEGDELVFDFAHSFTIRRPNGLLAAVNRKGQIVEVSPYSPARAQKRRSE